MLINKLIFHFRCDFRREIFLSVNKMTSLFVNNCYHIKEYES